MNIMSEKQKRVRNKSFTIRLTNNEHKQIVSVMKNSKIPSQHEFFLTMIINKPIVVIDGLMEILPELKKQGTNINQIAKVLNETGQIETYERFKNVMNRHWGVLGQLNNIALEVQNAHL